jgi:nucleoid-associated protein YgaU
MLAGYLLVLTAASAVVRLLALPRATRLVDRFTLPVIRGVFGGAAALGVMVVPGPVHRPAQTATTSTVVTASVEDPDTQATLHLEVPDAEPVAPAPELAPAAGPADTWVVQPGDSLWSIAEAHLADVNGVSAADADVVVMWRRLIDLNRDRLVNPEEPDLIFADQVFELPGAEIG